MTFTGFPSAGLEFLDRLPDLTTAAFHEHADIYTSGIAEPSKAFVASLGPKLRSTVSDAICFAPATNRSIAPINNDRRFNPAIAPYKDHLLYRFWEGDD